MKTVHTPATVSYTHLTVSGADQLAEQIQQSLNQTVNAGNEKTEKRIDDTIYLMRQVLCPAVLVRCV